MQQGADDTKDNLLLSQDRLFDDVDGNCHRQIEEDRDGGKQPDELQPAGEPIQVKGIARDITPYFVQGIFDDLEKERPFISSESDAMRLFVDLRMLDEKGRLDTASELEGAAARIRGQQSAAD